MSTDLYPLSPSTPATAVDFNQIIAALTGTNDIAALTCYQPLANAGALTAAVGSGTGNLDGVYSWVVVWRTGWIDGRGQPHYSGNQTAAGTPSNAVSATNNPVDLTAIPIGPTGVIARDLYRTKAGGSTYYFLVTLADNVVTEYTDNTADADLGSATAPTVNTTGTIPQLPVYPSVPEFSAVAGTIIAVTVASGTTVLYRSDGSGWLALPDLAVANTWTGAQTFESATLSGVTTNSGTINGGVIASSTLSGTTTNSGTISGGTISGATLSGTTTNSGTISGGTVNPASGTVAGNWSAGPVVLWGGGVPSTPPLNVTALGWDFDPGTNSPGTSGFFNNYGTGNAGGFKWWVAAENATSWTNTASLDPSGNFSTVGSLTVGGTINGATLSGTTTNSGTISGGDLTPSTVTASTTVYVKNSDSGTTPGTTAGTYLGIGDVSNLFVKGYDFVPAINASGLVLIGSVGTSTLNFDGSLSNSGSTYGSWKALASTGANALQLAPAGSVTTQHNTLDNGSGDASIAGAISSVGGQSTTGSLGVGVVVASASATVTSTGTVTILSYTTTADGYYMMMGGVNVNNGTSGQDITFIAAPTSSNNCITLNYDGLAVTFSGSNSVENGEWEGVPLFYYVGSGGDILITYQDPGGTPNDTVWATIVRLV